MTTNIKSAAVINYSSEKGAVEIREISRPEIGEEDVLLEVANVGVCGSDLHQWTADHSWPVNYPVVLGHEFGGHIVELGSRVINWKLGDRVVSETAAVINPTSPLSRTGLYNLDPNRKGFGYGVNGLEENWGTSVVAEIGEDNAALHIEDISKEGCPDRLVALAIKSFGKLDALVNNAAAVVSSNIHTTDLTFLRRVIEVNTIAPFALIKAA